MGATPRVTLQGVKVLGTFLAAYEESVKSELSGADVMKKSGVSSGTMYPLLIRLEEAGWLNSRWEETEPQELGRPRRRLYSLTGTGVHAAREVQASLGLAFSIQAGALHL
jgi:PadR family transcriptional regulator, regulatory protein PadR